MRNTLILSGPLDRFARRVVLPALQSAVHRRRLDGVAFATGPEPLVRDFKPYDVAFVSVSARIDMVRALVAAGVGYAVILDGTAAGSALPGHTSEERLRSDEILRNAGAVLAGDAVLAAKLGRLVCDRDLDCRDLSDFVVPAPSGGTPPEQVLVIHAAGLPETMLARLRAEARKAGSHLHIASPREIMDADEATTTFLNVFTTAAIRVVESTSEARPDLPDRLAVLAAGVTVLATDGRPRDFARVPEADLKARGFAALAMDRGACSFASAEFGAFLASDLADAIRTDRSASGVEIAMLAATGRLNAPVGFVPRPRRPATFVVRPPTMPGPPNDEQPIGVEAVASRWLPALATGLPESPDGRAWRAELAQQAGRLERFALEWGLPDLDHPALPRLGSDPGRREDRATWLEAELGHARTLAEERLAAIVEMDGLIKERDATISWQGQRLVERWGAIEALQAALGKRDASGADGGAPLPA